VRLPPKRAGTHITTIVRITHRGLQVYFNCSTAAQNVRLYNRLYQVRLGRLDQTGRKPTEAVALKGACWCRIVGRTSRLLVDLVSRLSRKAGSQEMWIGAPQIGSLKIVITRLRSTVSP
jgi:hypothetical protein